MVVRRLVAAVLLGSLLVSCSDDESPSGSDDPTTPVTPSPTASESPPGPVEPELPAEARRPTRAGAIAFVKYYWAMVDYAQATGDLRTLHVLAARSCGVCAGGVKALRDLHRRGGRIVAGARHVHGLEARLGRMAESIVATVDFNVRVPSSREFYGEEDSRNRRWPPGENDYQFLLRWDASDRFWRVWQWVAS